MILAFRTEGGRLVSRPSRNTVLKGARNEPPPRRRDGERTGNPSLMPFVVFPATPINSPVRIQSRGNFSSQTSGIESELTLLALLDIRKRFIQVCVSLHSVGKPTLEMHLVLDSHPTHPSKKKACPRGKTDIYLTGRSAAVVFVLPYGVFWRETGNNTNGIRVERTKNFSVSSVGTPFIELGV